jgi:excisionase family DNA binding protein
MKPSGNNPGTTPIPAGLTVGEVADTLRCSERTVRNLISARELTAFYVGRGSRILRVTPAALTSYIESKTRTAKDAA